MVLMDWMDRMDMAGWTWPDGRDGWTSVLPCDIGRLYGMTARLGLIGLIGLIGRRRRNRWRFSTFGSFP